MAAYAGLGYCEYAFAAGKRHQQRRHDNRRASERRRFRSSRGQPSDDQIADGRHDRQRIPAVRLLNDEMEDRVRHVRDEQQRRGVAARATRATRTPQSAMATTIHPSGGAAHGPTSAAMMPSAIRRGVGLLRKISRPVNCSAAWPAKAARYCASPPLAMSSGIAHASTPIENVIALPSSAPRRAASRAIEQHHARAAEASARSSACACRRRAPRSARRRQSIGPTRAIAAGSAPSARRRRTNADARHACAASAMPRPGMSLSGRSAVNQNSGDATTTSVASAARRSRSASAAVRSSASMLLKQRHQRKHRQRAEQGAPQRQRTGVGRPHRVRQFAERDEDGISRRMRLMLRRIEVAHAEREVHRVEIFERRRQKRQVRDEENRRERGRPENLERFS